MKIGILGGTFNPPHIGHIVIAKEIKEFLGLDKVFCVPTNIPPHKQVAEIGSKHRLNMTKLMINGEVDFEVLDLELEKGGVSYTIDTVKLLKDKFPQDEFYLIVGSDLANSFSSWKNFEELKEIVKIVVAQREEYLLEKKDDFITVNITQVPISSSQIRGMIKEGEDIKSFVKAEILEYIEANKLYK
jgi:nicotinate-nucleotide adenylyltransferase